MYQINNIPEMFSTGKWQQSSQDEPIPQRFKIDNTVGKFP